MEEIKGRKVFVCAARYGKAGSGPVGQTVELGQIFLNRRNSDLSHLPFVHFNDISIRAKPAVCIYHVEQGLQMLGRGAPWNYQLYRVPNHLCLKNPIHLYIVNRRQRILTSHPLLHIQWNPSLKTHLEWMIRLYFLVPKTVVAVNPWGVWRPR